MGCTSSGTSLQEWRWGWVGYGLVAVGRASGEGVTGRDGWGDGKEYGSGDGGRRLGFCLVPCLAKPRA